MATPELRFPARLTAAYNGELRAVCGRWAEDERIEGILLPGKVYGWFGGDVVDVLVVARRRGHGGPPGYQRAAVGNSWLRVGVITYRELLREVQGGASVAFKLALRGAFVALDREGRLADVLRALGPALNEALPKARFAAAARVAAALRDAEGALASSNAPDAAVALGRACSNLAELELFNTGAWPAGPYPLAVYEGSPARDVYETLWPAAPSVGELSRVHEEASAVFRRYLPAAAAYVFDFLIKKGGSAALTAVAEELGLEGIPDLDSAFAALGAYGLLKVGKEEKPLPGLAGASYEEPVLTLP